MTPTERLNLLRTLITWALSTSEVVSSMIKEKYKQNRHNDDENQPLSVQPWGVDGDKRRYFLIQGLDDTGFRVYREGNRYTKNAHWWSVAGTIEEVKALAAKLEKEDGTQAARRLSVKMMNAVPTFEATEEKRRRREYRQQRRAAFSRPEPGFGIYEGRTRGKRMRYTYDEDADDFELSDATSTRRSTRHQSARSTPFDTAPTVTASGRQVRHPRTGDYGESLLSGNVMNANDSEMSGLEDETDLVRSGARTTRSGGSKSRKHIDGYNSIDEMSEEDEWNSDKNDDDVDDEMRDDERDSHADDEYEAEDDEEGSSTLVVKLKVPSNDKSNHDPQHSVATAHDTPPTSPPQQQPPHVFEKADQSETVKREAVDVNAAGEVKNVENFDIIATSATNTNGYPTPSSNTHSVIL